MSLLQLRPASLPFRSDAAARTILLAAMRYALPFAAVATATGLTYFLDLFELDSANLFLFFVAVVASAWFAGVISGWISVALSVLVVDYFFIPPLYAIDFNRKDLFWLAAFSITCIAANLVSLQRRRQDAALRQAHDELDIRVRERTSELRKANARLELEVVERERAQTVLRETQSELARVARIMTVGELAASIAHEVNQPLAAVVANGNAALNWLRHDPPDLAEARDSIAAIIAAGEHAGEVIGRIRSLMAKGSPHLAVLKIEELLDDVISPVQTGLKRRDIAVERRCEPGLPAIRGDRVQLQQLMLNLLNNAIDAMADISDRPRRLVARAYRAGAQRIEISVEDSGRGLGDADMSKLFQPFYSTKPDGMGMGLSICRTIAELHGGHISALPRSPHGAIFRVSLPIANKP